METIDIHSHFLPEPWPDLATRFGSPDWPWLKRLDHDRGILMLGEREYRPVYSACWDISKRLEEMDRDGVHHQIMCVTPLLFAYERTSSEAEDCARLFNLSLIHI